jgi:hypothetical protein
MIEVVLRREFIAAAIRAYPKRVRLYARNVGVFRLQDGRWFHSAIKGQADIWGYYRDKSGVTRPIEIELKRIRHKVDEAQEMWKSHCEEWDITYLMLVERKDDTDTVARFVKELGHAIET